MTAANKMCPGQWSVLKEQLCISENWVLIHVFHTNKNPFIVLPIKYSVSFNRAISQYVPQHFTFHNIILLILRHYGERMGIHSCKCIHQMGASKRVQIQRTEPHRLLAIYSPAFYVAHHRVRPIACWQTCTTLTTIDCIQLFYHCCMYELAQCLLKLTSKTNNTFLAFSPLLSLSHLLPLSFLHLHYVQTFHSFTSSTPL